MNPQLPTGDFALFLDIDGTLIDIAPHPDAVVVPDSLIRDLETMDHLLHGALALVSGRTIGNIDTLFKPLRLRASGVHGAEYRFDPHESGVHAGAISLPHEIWTDLLALIEAFPGTMAENKAFSFAVHYRSAPLLREPLLRALETLVKTQAHLHIRIMPGHFVFEIKRADFHKGIAVERFLDRQEFLGRRPIFIGDDVTDWPGFAATLGRGGLAYSVSTVAPDVTGTFSDPNSVRQWLTQIILSETVSA